MAGEVPVFPLSEKDLKAIERIYKNEKITGKDKNEVPFSAYGHLRQVLVHCYGRYKDTHKNIELRKEDVWVMGCPKSGLTLAQEMVWLLDHNLDFNSAKKVKLNFRSVFLETPAFAPEDAHKELRAKLAKECFDYFNYKNLINRRSPRHFKTHLMFSLLPDHLEDQAKVLYMAREVKDCMVLMYNFEKMCGLFADGVDFKAFANLYMDDLVTWGPYFSHLKEGWSKRHHPNVMFLFYEDMVKDLAGTIRQVSQFLGKSYSEDQLETLRRLLEAEIKREDEAAQPICRPEYANNDGQTKEVVKKGKSGAWREYFDDELLQKTEAWIARNLAGSDLHFPPTD